MKFWIRYAAVCIAAFTPVLVIRPASAQVLQQPFSLDEIVCREAAMHARTDEQLHDGHGLGLAPSDNYDLLRLGINWTLTPQTGYISGYITYRFKTLAPLDTFFLDMSDSLTYQGSWYHGAALDTAGALKENILAIALPQSIPVGSYDSISVFYEGLPASTGLGSYHVSGHNGDSIVATLSEPYGSRDWWPSKMSLTDKIDTLDIGVKVPDNYRVGSNGLLVKTDYLGSPFVVHHWQSRYPIATYLIGIAAYPYSEINHTVILGSDTLLVQNYMFASDSADWQNAMPNLDTVLAMFTERFGPYPFVREKYGHAQWNRGGGMEHQTMSFMGNLNLDLMAHELAHQWFGNKITCGSWSDIWLNEGFATWATGLAFENMIGGYWWDWYKGMNYGSALSDSAGSVYCTDTTDVFRIFNGHLTYAKGFYLLHQLRFTMGDDKFFEAIKNYVQDTTLAYKTARTAHVKTHLESVYGSSLDDYFNDWFYGKGYPNLVLHWAQDANRVRCRLFQQPSTDNGPGFVFDMNVPVVFYGAGADTTLVLPNHSAQDGFDFTLPFVIDSISIDPDLWWLIGGKTVESNALLFDETDITLYPNPTSGNFFLESARPGEVIHSVEIFAADGRLVWSRSALSQESFDPLALQAEMLSAGVYAVRTVTNVGAFINRLVKSP